MSDWTSGYVADIGYTHGYYQELNPTRFRLAFLNQGLLFPEVGTACELGFGQGLSANIHAAASVTHWYGTDFNPSQAGFAQELAAASASGAKLYDEAFADFCNRSDLPDFDYIGLHGIWSWISDENRQVIVDFIRKKLKVGGVLYISYNTLPGWSAFAPMRHLMTQHAEVLGAEGRGIVSRIDGAIDFADKLLAANPAYARANPQIAERMKQLKGHSRHYLAHEYFNADWHPMHFATMAEWLGPAKLQYACSANYLDYVDALNLTAQQQDLLKEIPDPMFRQTVRDFMVNQQFRKDYWVKGSRQISPLQQAEALRSLRLMLVSPSEAVSLKVTGSVGEATMAEAIYKPVLNAMADHQIRTFEQLEILVADHDIAFAQLLQAVVVLTGAGHLAVVQDESTIRHAKAKTNKLNAYLCKSARDSNQMTFLASPVTGGGVAVGRFQQLFLLAIAQGQAQPAHWAHFAWSILASQGQQLLRDGQALQTPADNLAELTAQANAFAAQQLPILRALQIV